MKALLQVLKPFGLLALLASVSVVGGCSPASDAILFNNLGSGVSVLVTFANGTTKAGVLAARSSVKFDPVPVEYELTFGGTSGRVKVPGLPREFAVRKGGFKPREYTFQIEPDHRIYLIRPGLAPLSKPTPQPTGFPM